jgi:coenzyme PQQ precursor peptide PqqA
MRLVLMVARSYVYTGPGDQRPANNGGNIMKVWSKPAVREQEVGLEVTSYLPAEIDII